MSASTATAAVPEPNNTPSTAPGPAPQNAPAPGLLTSMLAPVAPARTAAFTLDPQAADSTPATGAALPTEGLTSAAFHGDNDGQKGAGADGKGDGSGQQQKGVVRAWLLAGAARWARGGGTQNKRLDMQKARAAAHQVKETRTVNKSDSPLGASGGRGGFSGSGGKSLGSKSPKSSGQGGQGALKGPKNSSGSTSPGADRGPAGRDNNRSTDRSGSGSGPKGAAGTGGGRGTPGGTSSDRKNNNSAPKTGTDSHGRTPKPNSSNDTRAPKPSKDNSSSPKGSTGGTSGGGKNGAPGPTGSTGKSGTSNNGGKTLQPEKQTTPTKDTKPQTGKDTPSSKPGDKTNEKPPTEKTTPKQEDKAGEPKPNGTNTKAPTNAADKTGGEKKPTTPAPANGGKTFTTRPSRETGYRDGTRAAKATAHVKAYRDGVKDGFTDTIEAADREKARLDQAHTDRKTARQETPVPLAASTDHHQNAGPTPISVDSVSKTHVTLGDGATRASMSRGEVRSLKDMERRLEERATNLTNKAEQTRNLKAHADEQATKATRLLEAARGAKGGDKLVGALTKLQEAAQTQATKAEEIHKRALRAAEATRTTLSNVQTRYGGIYQAVIDSPEHAPGELDFYKG